MSLTHSQSRHKWIGLNMPNTCQTSGLGLGGSDLVVYAIEKQRPDRRCARYPTAFCEPCEAEGHGEAQRRKRLVPGENDLRLIR